MRLCDVTDDATDAALTPVCVSGGTILAAEPEERWASDRPDADEEQVWRAPREGMHLIWLRRVLRPRRPKPVAPRRLRPARARGAGRPRGRRVCRVSARSGDSGEPGESEPPATRVAGSTRAARR